MDNKFSYTIVGLFVAILTSAFFIISIWLSVGLKGEKYHNYIVYMNESVSGLSIKAPVKYSGVEVGYVSDVNLRLYNPKQVQLILSIKEGTPITADTRAELSSQGLTGIAYIELNGGNPASPPLLRQPGEKYPVIRSEPSLLFRLDAALDHLSKNLDSITSGLSSVLNRENTVAFKNILSNLDNVTTTLNSNTHRLDIIIKDTQTTMQNASRVSVKLPEMVDRMGEASKQASVTFANATGTVQTINDQLLPQFLDVMSEVQTILENVKNLSEQLDQDPSVLLRGKNSTAARPRRKKQSEANIVDSKLLFVLKRVFFIFARQ